MRHLKLWCLTNGDESGGWRTRGNDEVLYGTAALRDVRWVAGMVAYLAGTEAGFVTGVNLSAPDCEGAKRPNEDESRRTGIPLRSMVRGSGRHGL